MERVVHRVVGVHLVDQPDLHPVAHSEAPVDRLAEPLCDRAIRRFELVAVRQLSYLGRARVG